MRLVLDIGNTLIKSYVFEQEKILEFTTDSKEKWKESLQAILNKFSTAEKGNRFRCEYIFF